MKQIIHKTLGIAIIAFFSHTAMATDVTSTFTTGATLTATQMTEIKDAVNSKQNRVSGTCSVGSSIRLINADGTVNCQVDTDTNTTYTAGSGISISGNAISTPARTTVTVVDSASVAASSFACLVVSCPVTHVFLVGGGVDLNNVLTMVVTQSTPSVNGNRPILVTVGTYTDTNTNSSWRGCARNNDTTTAQTFAVAAVCSDK